MTFFVFKINCSSNFNITCTLTNPPSIIQGYVTPISPTDIDNNPNSLQDGQFLIPSNFYNTQYFLSLSELTCNLSAYIIPVFLQSLKINWQPNTTYTFQINENFVYDTFGQGSPAQTITYTTNFAPSILASDPQSGDTATLNNDNITLDFKRQVFATQGSFYLFQVGPTTPTLIRQYHVDVEIRYSHGQIILDTRNILQSGTTYYLLADPNCLIDYDGFNWDGLISPTSFRFTTSGEPAFKDLIATESSQFTVSALGGYLKQTTASLIARFSIIKPTPFGFISSQGNASLSSYSSLTAISWNKILHFSIPRTYQSNTSTFVFTTGNESPVIDDPELSATYTITLVTTNGGFNCSLTGDSTYTTSSTWTYTGTGTYINQSVLSSIKYLPTVNTSDTKTVNYTIQKVSGGSNTWTKSGSFSINWTSLGTFGSVYVFTSYGYSYNQTWSPNLEEYQYGKMDLLIIGGGGAGAWGEFIYGGAGSGGGAGQVLYPTNIAITNQSYTANVGTGGVANSGTPFAYQVQPSGTSTTFSTYTAVGGGGGAGPAGTGGNSGNGFSGGNGYTSGANGGGGGGGGATTGGANGISSGSGGSGGSGYTSSISGSSIIYAVGGGGGATTGGSGTGNNAGHSNTPGSGGGGGSSQGNGLSNGMPGIVIIKTHN